MKVISIFCIVLFTSLSSYAQEMTCLEKLLTYSRFSGFHQLSRDEWTDTTDQLTVSSAKAALNSLLGSKLLCDNTEVVIKSMAACNLLVADVPQSNVCHIYTNLGYFVVSKDNGRNINFIFSKDSRFAGLLSE
ncbi:MAG TPA: hypothetical protein VNJ01_04060 [Bacteriovoracaceae bacterium]|nr:hypothetical protein [Bacteriovoracaceae bacterium]